MDSRPPVAEGHEPPRRPARLMPIVVQVVLGLLTVAGTYVVLAYATGALHAAIDSRDQYAGLLGIGWGAIAQIFVTVPVALSAWRRGWKAYAITVAVVASLAFLSSSLCMGSIVLDGGL